MSLLSPVAEGIDHLDFEIPCSLPRCDHTADWWMVCRGCNRHVPWCEPCRRRETTAAIAASREWRVGCTGCGESVAARRWRDLFDVVPIAGT